MVLLPGNYTVTVTDANGCTGTHVFTVTQPTPVSATTTPTNISCFGEVMVPRLPTLPVVQERIHIPGLQLEEVPRQLRISRAEHIRLR